MTGIDYAARVARGAALLDERRPGWEREIDLDEFDISDGNFCITAQLYGGFWRNGMVELGLTDRNGGTYISHGFQVECTCCGFPGQDDAYDQEAAYAALNAEWRRVITARRGAMAVTA